MKIVKLLLPPILGGIVGFGLAFLYCLIQLANESYEVAIPILFFSMLGGGVLGSMVSVTLVGKRKTNPSE